MMTNRPEFLETMFAVNALGAIAVPVNFRLAPGEIAFILDDSGARLLVTDEGCGPAAASAVAECGHEVTLGSTGDMERSGEPPPVDVPEDSPALTVEELRTWGTERIARYKLPTVMHVLEALPRNASGKVMKTVLREQFGG